MSCKVLHKVTYYTHRVGIGIAQLLHWLGYALYGVGFSVWQRQAISLFIKTDRLWGSPSLILLFTKTNWLWGSSSLILLSSKQTGYEAHQSSYYCSSKQTGCEAHQASYSMGTGCSFTGVKVAGLWGWRHSPPASAEIKLSVDCTSAAPCVLMVCTGTTSAFPPLCTVRWFLCDSFVTATKFSVSQCQLCVASKYCETDSSKQGADICENCKSNLYLSVSLFLHKCTTCEIVCTKNT
jgi:hypothetical protein